MIHPIFMTALRRPELLFNHVSNYTTLLKGELAAIGTSLAMRAAGAVVALAALLLALGLTGFAVMLGVLHDAFHLVLIVVPATAWLLAAVGGVLAMRSSVGPKVEEVKDELEADLAMLRLVKKASHD